MKSAIQQEHNPPLHLQQPLLRRARWPHAAATAPAANAKIGIEDFAKVELRVGLVKSAERIPGADKILKLMVDIGEEIAANRGGPGGLLHAGRIGRQKSGGGGESGAAQITRRRIEWHDRSRSSGAGRQASDLHVRRGCAGWREVEMNSCGSVDIVRIYEVGGMPHKVKNAGWQPALGEALRIKPPNDSMRSRRNVGSRYADAGRPHFRTCYLGGRGKRSPLRGEIRRIRRESIEPNRF